MNLKRNLPRALVAGSCLLALGSFAAFSDRGRTDARGGRGPTGFPLTGGTFERPRSAALPAEPGSWKRPEAQRAGSGWIYELFTPPRIHFDPAARSFSAARRGEPPPPVAVDRAMNAMAPASRSEAEARDLFPIQLVGFAGDGEEARGIFAVPATGETIVAGSGTPVKSLGLVIERVSVDWRRVALPDSMTVSRRSATAVVRLVADGQRRELTDATSEPAARLATNPPGDGGAAFVAGSESP